MDFLAGFMAGKADANQNLKPAIFNAIPVGRRRAFHVHYSIPPTHHRGKMN
jgi:hypothetical protein